ncbi:MAG: Coq4 family protein [Rhizomicrobium sp.]
MISSEQRQSFEALAARQPELAAIQAAARAARVGDTAACVPIAAALVHCAFAAPETAEAVYAAFRDGWLGEAAKPAMPEVLSAPLSPSFWTAFWQLLDETVTMDALTITSRVAALGAFVDPCLRERAEAVAAHHPKAARAATRTPPPRLTLDELARQPEGSLAHDFWRLIVDNKFDLEVLDREAINLSSLPPALCYLNTRILQMHDIWHLVGGFHTTALHEIAISAFQQAQFGHGYSAMFLAVVVSRMALSGGEAAPVILQTIAEASQYGADCPSFMAIAWEKEWQAPLSEIRARHGIAAFKGSYPADHFEQLRSAA